MGSEKTDEFGLDFHVNYGLERTNTYQNIKFPTQILDWTPQNQISIKSIRV
jgi:hypothetical protein